ncbi:MAG: CHAT domain-containing protein [bacterium]
MKYSFHILLSIAFLFIFSAANCQEVKKTELDSIYALQGKLYRAKEFKEIIELSNYARSFPLNNAQDSITFARIIAYIGYSNNRFNNFYNSIAGFEEALKYIPDSDDFPIARTKQNISYDLMTRYYSVRKYQKALKVALQCEDILNNHEQFRDRKFTYLYQRKFRIYSALGFYEQAKKEVEKLRQLLLKETSESDDYVRSGWIRYYRSSLLANYNEALYISDGEEGFTEEMEPLRLALFHDMGKLDSIYENTSSLQNPKTRNQKSDLSIYIGALYYTSDFCKEIGQNELALTYVEKALSLVDKADEPDRNVGEFLRFRANVLNELGDSERALKLISDLENKFDGSRINLNEIYTFKGDIYAKQKLEDSTVFYYRKALEIMHNDEEELKSDFSNFSSRLQFPNDCKQMQHMSEILLKYFPEKNRIINVSQRFSDLAYEEFLTNHSALDLSRGNQQLYNSLVSAQLNQESENVKDINVFVSNLENISNRLAWQRFSRSRDVVQLPVIDSLEQVEFTIRKQLVQARRARDAKKTDSINEILNGFQKSVEAEFPTISNFTQDNFDIKEFQKQVQENEIVLKYLFFKEQFAVFQISKDDIFWELLPWTETEQQLVTDHLAYLKDSKQALPSSDALTKLLIPEHAMAFDKLTIIPDEPIYFLPFETLVLNASYLVKTKAVRYSSHLRFAYFGEDNNATKKDTKATIFAPEYAAESTALVTRSAPVFLEGAQKEAKELERLFPSEAFIGNSATKANFITHKSEGNILHMAMHATIDEDNPGFSHFNFSENEKLFLEELYALKIPADLAVLSACNTAVGQTDASLSINSLHRAFNYAGTKATVASLWEVPDETTSKIMISFYNNLKKGNSKSEALQKAKVAYIETAENERLKHPYYWAGFVLYGTDAPVASAKDTWYWLLGFIALGSLLYSNYRRKKKAA